MENSNDLMTDEQIIEKIGIEKDIDLFKLEADVIRKRLLLADARVALEKSETRLEQAKNIPVMIANIRKDIGMLRECLNDHAIIEALKLKYPYSNKITNIQGDMPVDYETEKRIREFIIEKGKEVGVSSFNISNITSEFPEYKRSHILNILTSLLQEKVITRKGIKKGTKYYLKGFSPST